MTGKDLKEWRKSLKITRKRLATLTGYTTGGLLRIEKAENKKLTPKLLILIEALKNNA